MYIIKISGVVVGVKEMNIAEVKEAETAGFVLEKLN